MLLLKFTIPKSKLARLQSCVDRLYLVKQLSYHKAINTKTFQKTQIPALHPSKFMILKNALKCLSEM